MLKEIYLKLINEWNGTTEDLCYEIYKLLCKEPCKGTSLKMLCEIFDYDEPEDAEYCFFTKEEIYALKMSYGKFIDETIKSVINSIYLHNKTLDNAYDMLWNMIFENQFILTDKEKAFALFWVVIDDIIPYRSLNKAVRMKSEQFKGVCEKLEKSIDQIQYIIDFPFEQKTETASLILEEILKTNKIDERTVLMAHALALYTEKFAAKLRKELSSRDD